MVFCENNTTTDYWLLSYWLLNYSVSCNHNYWLLCSVTILAQSVPRALAKTGMAGSIAASLSLKKHDVVKVIGALAGLGAKDVTTVGR